MGLLTREWNPQAGKILLDGKPLTDYSEGRCAPPSRW